jgi:pyruvate dehydrogenase E1 component alpha subunit
MTALGPRSSLPPAITSDVFRVFRDDGSIDEQHDPGLSDDELTFLYQHMVQTRRIDERFISLQRQGRIPFHVGSLGEEAAIIGSAFAMRPSDWIFPCYREFGAALMRGFPLQRLVDNVYGNAGDIVKGRQMPHHYTHRVGGWASISSPVGTQITQAVGFAWGSKIKHEDVSVLVYFGDGSTSSADFHSGMNFAGVLKVPLVLFCRNNGWAISVPVERQTASATFAEKGPGYGIPGVRVDGNDALAVVAVTRRAAKRAAEGNGPTLIEAITYRMGGHTTADDPDKYRGLAEMEVWAQVDPIERMQQLLITKGIWDAQRDVALREEIDERFRLAAAKAEATPPPSLETMFDDVYEKLPWHLAEQRAELLAGPRAPGGR